MLHHISNHIEDSKMYALLVSSFLISVFSRGCASPVNSEAYSLEYFNKIIKDVKNSGALWEAGHNFEENEEFRHLVNFLDALDEEEIETKLKTLNDGAELSNSANPKVGHSSHSQCLPETVDVFNGLEEFKYCKSVGRVWNQGRCASDWAIAPAAAFTDRLCIASNGTFTETISPETPLACCKTCGWGCRKGYAHEVNDYFVKYGGVTGGTFGSSEGCQPYSLWPSTHAKYFQRPYAKTPKCQNQCTNSKYKKTFGNDIIKAKRAVTFGCPCWVPSTLRKHGPIIATMIVYEDFITYKSGIYHHVTGKALGKLTVKIVGYNQESDIVEENYWIAVNSWGKKWGDNGTFKIRKWRDECLIEDSLQAIYVDANTDVSVSSSEEDY